ncbi:MAG TPA: helix-turn-helix transcriptional regulator [Ktedonobacterales bacterium]|nr:helix-turn-helix transcriptional regulator [Ktedonobacterales bacterium]
MGPSSIHGSGSLVNTVALSGLVDQIGEPGFGDALLELLYGVCAVEHLLIYRLTNDRLSQVMVASHGATEYIQWAGQHFLDHYVESDPLQPAIRVAAANPSPRLFRTAVESTPHRKLFVRTPGPRAVRERVIVSGRAADAMLAVSLVRPGHDKLDAQTAAKVLEIFPLLLSMIGKHEKLCGRETDVVSACSSLELIEPCVASSSARLSRREAQVCARIIYGMSTSGIALDLDIGGESVATYRKRAYRRLGIGSQFELMRWYMAEWGAQRRLGR